MPRPHEPRNSQLAGALLPSLEVPPTKGCSCLRGTLRTRLGGRMHVFSARTGENLFLSFFLPSHSPFVSHTHVFGTATACQCPTLLGAWLFLVALFYFYFILSFFRGSFTFVQGQSWSTSAWSTANEVFTPCPPARLLSRHSHPGSSWPCFVCSLLQVSNLISHLSCFFFPPLFLPSFLLLSPPPPSPSLLFP